MVADGRALSNYCYDCCALQRQLSERFFIQVSSLLNMFNAKHAAKALSLRDTMVLPLGQSMLWLGICIKPIRYRADWPVST